jgi:polygalacturonase
LQDLISRAQDNALIIIKKGTYLFTSLMMRSNITICFEKEATLIASTNVNDYEELPGEVTLDDGSIKQIGTWEGSPSVMKKSLITGIDVENVAIVGEGLINGRANESTWWENFREKPYARPHMVYFVSSSNIHIQGVNFKNSTQWTIHPYFCHNVGFYDFSIENPKVSPNTDGLNPQCCDHVEIIGIHFSVGDDCIAIKSGKMYIGKKYQTPCQNITIRNCLMQYGHGAIVLGSEMSGGIKKLHVEKCIFDSTDRGLRIKTRRGRGNTAIIDGVTFSHIIMKHVLTPLVINMFYFCDPDGKTEYVWSKEKLPVDDRTPYLGKFTFKNIVATDCEYAAGYFYGLPEMPIEEINIIDCSFSFAPNAGSGTPAMMSFAETCSKRGFIFNNVNHVLLSNVKCENIEGDLYQCNGNLDLKYE